MLVFGWGVAKLRGSTKNPVKTLNLGKPCN